MPKKSEPGSKQKAAEPEPREQAGGTRERILNAALEVFAEKGLHGATVVEIAKRAGMTGGALYRYYPSKEEIFKAVIEQHSVAFTALEMLRDLMPELKPVTALKFIAQGMFLYFASNVDFIRVAVSESLRDPELSRPFFNKMLEPSSEFVKSCIDLWKEQGLLRDDVDTSMATSAFMGMMGFMLVERAFMGSDEIDLSDTGEAADRCAQIFLQGILKQDPE